MRAFLWAIFAVLNAASLAAWGISVATSKHHHPLNFWLVIALVILTTSALLWGWGRPKTHGATQHFHAPVTINQGPALSAAPQAGVTPFRRAENVSPQAATTRPQLSDRGLPIVYISDLLVHTQDRLLPLRGLEFRNTEIRGPAMLYFRHCHVTGGVEAPDGDIENALFEVPPGRQVTGVIPVENCIFENCDFVGIGIMDIAAGLDEWRRAFSRSEPDGGETSSEEAT
jgi:hypothetical protein